GTVTDAAGKPVVGAEVIYDHVRNPAKTDDKGHFDIDKVFPSQVGKFRSYSQMNVRHPDFVENNLRLRADQQTSVEKPLDLKVELDPGVVLSGKLTEEGTGKPLDAYAVAVESMHGFLGTAYSDAEGKY